MLIVCNDIVVLRELLEESCLTAKSLNKVGLLMFEFIGDEQLMEVHVFKTSDFEGIPSETNGKGLLLLETCNV